MTGHRWRFAGPTHEKILGAAQLVLHPQGLAGVVELDVQKRQLIDGLALQWSLRLGLRVSLRLDRRTSLRWGLRRTVASNYGLSTGARTRVGDQTLSFLVGDCLQPV